MSSTVVPPPDEGLSVDRIRKWNRRNTFSGIGSPAAAHTLDICVRYTLSDDDSLTPRWMTISIPRIIPFLEDLSVAQKANIGSSNTPTKLHKHNFDNLPRKIPKNFNILKNSFPFVSLDKSRNPFYSSAPSFKADLSSACIGSTIYCLGGDSDDIVDGLQEIYDDDTPLPPPVDDDDDWGGILWGATAVDNEIALYETLWGDTSTKTQTTVSGVTDTTTTTGNVVKAKVDGGGGICHKIWFRDMSNPDSEWTEGAPLISPRLYPRLVSYQGKLYAFGGNRPCDPFAEVYDPKSEIWTLLEPPPFGRLCFGEFLVVPLKGWDRLWVFSVHLNCNIDYTYDVLTGKWQKFECANDIMPMVHRFRKQSSLASVVTPENHAVVYWVNYKGLVFAYNLSTRVLYKGTVDGFPRGKKQFHEGMHVTLSHLYRDFFCLIGREVQFSGAYEVIIHITLLQISLTAPRQVSHNGPLKPLSAAVLACFAYPFLDYIDVTDAYIMSDDIIEREIGLERW